MRWLFCIILLFVTGCGDDREKIDEVPVGYSGEARFNPYLAAEIYLKEKGWSANSSRTWASYDYETSMIFMPASFLQSEGLGRRSLEWVSEGGTLILMASGGKPERNDFTARNSGDEPEEGDYPGWDYLLEELNIQVETNDWSDFIDTEVEPEEDGHLSRYWHVTRLKEEQGGHHLELEGDLAMNVTSGSQDRSWDTEVDGQSRVLGTSYGSGNVLIFSHARPFRSPYLARADHAEFLEDLANTFAAGEIVFLYGSSNSFFGLIWKKGHMIVIAGLTLLAFWLWMRIPRFGPILHDSFKRPRPYGEELKASARFLWRRGQVEHLLRPLRARLEKDNQGDPETLYERLAEESELQRDEVAQALTINPPKDPGHLLKIVQKLQTLLKR